MNEATIPTRAFSYMSPPNCRSRKAEIARLNPVVFYLLCFCIPILAGSFLASGSRAQAVEEPVVVDPLDALCASIDRPVSAEALAGFSGYVLRGISSPYTEVIGQFREGRARSVRYLPEDARSAQYVEIKDRKICFASNGSNEAVCGVPLVCTSGEADFVMVDENDRPYAKINKPLEPAAPLAENDWVEFAGGSTRMTIESTRFRGNGATPARNITPNDRCKIGAGHPGLDQAYAYFWGAANCNSRYATGANLAIYITRDGDVRSARFGPNTGIQTENGNLFWSFNQPIPLSIECSNSDDTQIPQSAEDIKHIVARLTVDPRVNLAEPLIYNRLVTEADRYIERICGIRPLADQTEYLFERSGEGNEGNVELSLILNRNVLGLRSAQSPAYRQASRAQTSTAQNVVYARKFAVYIRQLLESERRASLLRLLRGNGRLVNLADGVRAGDVETLVALIDGLTIRMPWARLNPSYADGKFQISWSQNSSDPVNDFFSSRLQHSGWRSIQSRIPPVQNRVSIRLTCYLPGSEADSLPVESFVDVEATLIRHDANNYVFRCVAP